MSGIELRSFNQKGIASVKDFLKALRDGGRNQNPIELLDDRSLTRIDYEDISVESRGFATRRDAAKYFHQKFEAIPSIELRSNAGLWTWLSLFYFDQICPEIDGLRKVRNDYTYIFMPDQSMYFYRHLLFVAWYVKHVSPTYNRLFLDTTVHQLDRFTEDVFKRLYLTRIDCIFEVLDRLYWDRQTNRPRKGVNSPGKTTAGDLIHRFPTRIRQLEKTYDLMSLSTDQLLQLLGDEFSHLTKPVSQSS